MKNVRLVKCLVTIFMMIVSGIFLWVNDTTYGMTDLRAIIPFVSLMLGSVHSLAVVFKRSMKDVLCSIAVVVGIYLILRFVPNLVSDNDIEFLYGVAFTLMGVILVLLGVNLWSGFDYNIVRLRNCSIGLSVICFLYVVMMWRTTRNLPELIDLCSESIILMIFGISVFVISSDPSLGFSSLTKRMSDNVKSMSVRMISMKDAYILSPNVELIRDLVYDRPDGSVHMLLMSNEYGSRTITLRKDKDTGAVRLDVHAPNHTFMNPLRTIDVRDLYITDRDITIYGDNGDWMRFSVYDSIQEDYNKAMILGHQIDIDKFINNRKLGRIVGKNKKDELKRRNKIRRNKGE